MSSEAPSGITPPENPQEIVRRIMADTVFLNELHMQDEEGMPLPSSPSALQKIFEHMQLLQGIDDPGLPSDATLFEICRYNLPHAAIPETVLNIYFIKDGEYVTQSIFYDYFTANNVITTEELAAIQQRAEIQPIGAFSNSEQINALNAGLHKPQS